MNDTPNPGLRNVASSLVQRLANIKAGLISVSDKLEARPAAPVAPSNSTGKPAETQTLPPLTMSTSVAHALVDDIEAILQEIEVLL